MELLLVNEVANILRVKKSTIYAMVRRGEIPYIQLVQGRRKTTLRFSRDSIEDFLRKKMKRAKKEYGL